MSRINHEPYVPATESPPEFTLKAVLLGLLFGLIFGATTSYLALKVGLTVSASIPIAVLAISLFKKFGNATILENNIVQTIGSSGESIAAGVAFTLPALVFLTQGKDYFNYLQIFFLALIGGLLGVLFMIPLRRTLIVQEHGRLPYPEGVACADILVAGEKGGNLAKKVYWGIGIAFIYKTLMSIFGLWKEVPHYIFNRKSALPNANLAAEITPELLGVGYIIGIRSSSLLFAGGLLSSFVLIPLISYFGDYITTVVAPSTKLISQMSGTEIWSKYVRFIGAGAVTLGGIVTMIRTAPTVVQTIKKTYESIRQKGANKSLSRLDQDLSPTYVIGGSVLLFAALLSIPNLPVNWYSALIIVVAGFVFVSVASRITGIIGSSSNPISGMTIATLMATSLLFIFNGWAEDIYQPIALCVGAIVAIAAANAGATSQDLKTGFLIGATPIKQQIGLILGVLASACAVGFTIVLLYNSLGFGEITPEHPYALPAPQATLMSTILKGLFDQSLPWGLVLVGMAISAVVELCGVNSLGFAVGVYLPMSTTAPIFIGGLIKWLVRKRKTIKAEESDLESGSLFSAGLIAGGALTGILVAVLLGTSAGNGADGRSLMLMDHFNTQLGESLGARGDLIALGCFIILCLLLYRFAVKDDDKLAH